MASGELGNLLVRISADVTELKKQLANAQKQVQGNTRKFGAENAKTQKGFAASARAIKSQWMAVTASVMAAAVAVRMFAATVTEFSDFEQGLTNVKVLLGDNKKDIGLFSKEVERLALTYGVSTKKILKSLFDIQSATGKTTKSMDILNAATELSVAGASDMTATTSGLLTLMESYSDELLNAADASDLLFIAQVRARATIAELSESSGSFLPIAAELNVGVEDLFAAYSKMTLSLGNVNESSTAMTGILNGLLKPTDELQSKVKEWFGVSVQQAVQQGKFLDIMEKLGTVSKEEIGRMIPRIRGLKGLLSVSQDINKVKQFAIEFTKREGAVSKALADQMDTTARKSAILREQVAKAKREAGEVVVDLGVLQLLSAALKAIQLVAAEAKLQLQPLERMKQVWKDSNDVMAGVYRSIQKIKDLINEIREGGPIIDEPDGQSPEEAAYNKDLAAGEEGGEGGLEAIQEENEAKVAEEVEFWNSIGQIVLEGNDNINSIIEEATALSKQASDAHKLQVLQDAKIMVDAKVAANEAIGISDKKLAARQTKINDAVSAMKKKQMLSDIAFYASNSASMLGIMADGFAVAQGESEKYAKVIAGLRIAEAIMNTAAGVSNALATGGPFPMNLIAAAVVGAAGAVQIATIASQGFAEGTDSVPANLTPGEMVVPRGFASAIRSGDLTLGGPPDSKALGLDEGLQDIAATTNNFEITVNGNVDDPQELAELIATETDRIRRGG